jgi:transposase
MASRPPLSAASAAIPDKDDPTIWRVDDDLWSLLAPILKSDKARKKPSRPRRENRAIFDGLIWLARIGSQRSQLPREFSPKSTVHERFREWVASGALERGWAVLLREYDRAIGLDWTLQAADGCIVKAPFGKKGALAKGKPRGATPPIGANRAPNGTC